jgi:hypothetical protein
MDSQNLVLSQLGLVRELAQSPGVLQILGLLEAIEVSYKERLVDVTVEDLHKVQGAVQQVQLLRRAITQGDGIVPLL